MSKREWEAAFLFENYSLDADRGKEQRRESRTAIGAGADRVEHLQKRSVMAVFV